MKRSASRRGGVRLASPPEKPTPTAPPSLLTPLQGERLSELLLAHSFAVSFLFFWHARTDPVVVERFASWVAPGLSQIARRQAREQFNPAKGEDHDTADSPAILEAATRWYISLRLPATRSELWSGPPIDEGVPSGAQSGEVA
jgi:hypothetical protein